MKAKLAVLLSVLVTATVIFGYIVFRPWFAIDYVRVCEEADPGCHETGLPYQDSSLSVEERVDDLLLRMTTAEKIGQMALIEKNSVKDLNDIAKYGLGALLSGAGGKPNNNTPEGWLGMVDDFQDYADKTRLAIPLLYGVDAIHGHANVPGAVVFPHFIGLGAAGDPDLVREVAKATSEETAATGIYWIFSPNLDVVGDTRWGRTYESFGSDPELVSMLGKAYVEGLAIVGSAKHYVGQGSVAWGNSHNRNFFIDQGNSHITEQELRQRHLKPFERAVEAGVESVLVGLHNWNGEKVSFSKYLLTDVLKEELGFNGFVFSDWYGVYENELDRYKALVRAINAGVDMIMLPFDYHGFSVFMHRALDNGDISLERINEAARRILKVKFQAGLFDKNTAETDLSAIGSEAHRELAREAVRKSIVSLKDNNVLPIAKNATILVAGSAADNLGKQSGGWTVEWQGIDGNWIPGTTILDGIKDAALPGAEIKYALKGNFPTGEELADIGIAVVGENPYAEGWGDNENPKLSEQDIEAIYNLKRASKKIVVIIVSGRPLNITECAKDWDAVIAAWLPGTEGHGVADVLFGDYPFTGTLPVAWDF